MEVKKTERYSIRKNTNTINDFASNREIKESARAIGEVERRTKKNKI